MTTNGRAAAMWLNGGYLAAKETISLPEDTQDNKGKAIRSGTTFAVVLKRTDKSMGDTDESAWTAVTGNPLSGYTLWLHARHRRRCRSCQISGHQCLCRQHQG